MQPFITNIHDPRLSKFDIKETPVVNMTTDTYNKKYGVITINDRLLCAKLRKYFLLNKEYFPVVKVKSPTSKIYIFSKPGINSTGYTYTNEELNLLLILI